MAKPVVNIALIRQAEERALRIMSANESVDFHNRKTNSNNEFLMAEIRTEFQAAAYTYYLAGRLGLLEFKVCLFFDKASTQTLLFSMIESQDDSVTLTNLRNMTKLKLTDKLLNNIVEFYYEFKSWKTNKESTH